MSTSIFIFHSQELPSLEAYIDHHFTSHKKLLGLGGLGLGGLGSLKVENYLGSLQAYIDFKFVYNLTNIDLKFHLPKSRTNLQALHPL